VSRAAPRDGGHARGPADANALQHAAADVRMVAVERLQRLHGALELTSALLALLLGADSPRVRHAFALETAGVRAADELLAHAQHLGAARLPWFERLAERMALQPLPARQDLLRSARRLMAAGGTVRPLDRLHWLALRRALGERAALGARRPAAPAAPPWLDAERSAIARYAAFLSRIVPVAAVDGAAAPAGADWYAAALEPWQLAPLDPPDAIAMQQALGVLQTVPMLQRPLLLRAWVAPAIALSPGRRLTDDAADALRLTAGLLDSPMPPGLSRHYSGAEPPRP
jgi:hypothetical protein